MKYMTKEWYICMQKQSLDFGLREDARAETRSEALFHELYRKEKARYEKSSPQLMASEGFRRVYNRRVKRWKSDLPMEILNMVADFRVLALGYATAEVIDAIHAFSEKNVRSVEKGISDYQAVFEQQFGDAKPDFLKNFYFDDNIVSSFRKKGKDYIICSEDECGVELHVFQNATIRKLDRQLRGARGMYVEVYRIESGYEIHVLFEKIYKKNIDEWENLIELIVECENAVYTYQEKR